MAGTPEMSRSRVSAVAGGESSPSSAESNFRELDDAFLQSQTRIWLGEVLQIRFDEQTNISDLLADGELLFEVSEVISRMLPTLAVDTTHSKVNDWKSLASGKSTRRYMPYYNVGAFLRMCKNLGLDSIDLFTPSDVVEKRNTRKVCICLRSLSKKVRSRDLNVPDFDSVTRTLSMPTDMVQYIRNSLELSQSSSSLSVEQDSERVSRIRYWKRTSNPASPIGNGYSDDCDDAESSLMVSESQGSSNHACEAASSIILSPDVATNDESAPKLLLNMDIEDEGDVEGEYLSPPESVGSPRSEYYSDEDMSSVTSSTCLSSHVNGQVLEVNRMEKHGYQNVDVNHVPIDLEDSSWDIQNYKDGSETNDEIDDAHDREDEGKAGFNACSSLNKVNVENLAQPSEIQCESNLYDSTKLVCCSDSISVVDRELNVTHECAVEDDLSVGEAPISESESFEDEQVAYKDDISNSYSHDLCVIEDDFCADETPISKFKAHDEQQMAAKEETASNGFRPDSGEFHFDAKGNVNDLSIESPTHSPEILLIGDNSCHDSSNYVKNTLEDVVVGQEQQLHSEKCLCTVDSGAQFHLLPDIDTIIAADIHLNHQSLTINDKEAFDTNVITSDHTEKCFDANSMPIMDLSSFPSIDVTKDSVKFPDKVCEDTQRGDEDHHVVAQSIESKPIILEDSQEGSEVCSVLSESVVDNDKPINEEDANCVNSSAASLGNPQLGADSPSTEDNQCVETMQKSEPEDIGGEDNDKEIQNLKPQRKLLKSVVKGTALVGLAVFLLHLRKNIKLSLPNEKKQPVEATTRKPARPSSEKVQKASIGISSSVYPAEKLRLGI